jgi:hypothetical protein
LTWKESGLQIISSIIGSSLLLAVLTASIAEMNRPDVHINVITHEFPPFYDAINQPPIHKVEYYEIVVRNDGRSSATNMTLSMFFFSNLINSTAILHNENIRINIDQKHDIKKQGTLEPSVITANLPRLARGAMVIVYVWANAYRSE